MVTLASLKHHIYIHFPFCLYKCHYCDFNSYALESPSIPRGAYQQTLQSEINLRRALFEQDGGHFFSSKTRIHSVYFGGGTPSLMNPNDLAEIIALLQRDFVFDDKIEITLEANPGTIDLSRCRDFVSAGVTRFSVGVQSFQDKYLGRFGRIHTAAEAVCLLDQLVQSRIARVNLDLIYGFPGQTRGEWKRDLGQAMALGSDHLSCYALSCEEGTPFWTQVQSGRWIPAASETVRQMMDLCYDETDQQGLPAYEISNFARQGCESQHNLGYWHYEPFLGLGAGACGQYLSGADGLTREVNERDPRVYSQGVKRGTFFKTENINLKTAMGEFMMMGLRLREGVSAKNFLDRFQTDLDTVYRSEIETAMHKGLLKRTAGVIQPTREGFVFNNSLASLFVAA